MPSRPRQRRITWTLALLACLVWMPARAFTTVVIDAGHGGKDPGCHGHDVREKDLCLDVAKRLQKLLEAKEVKTVMTRTEDVFVALHERALVSNQQPDAIFVSIHFNACRDHSISGLEVHYRSKKGRALAGCIREGLRKEVKGRHRDGDWEDYKVLRETQAAAVLVECGFISNASEAARCADPDHRQSLAQGIASGILEAKTKL